MIAHLTCCAPPAEADSGNTAASARTSTPNNPMLLIFIAAPFRVFAPAPRPAPRRGSGPDRDVAGRHLGGAKGPHPRNVEPMPGHAGTAGRLRGREWNCR